MLFYLKEKIAPILFIYIYLFIDAFLFEPKFILDSYSYGSRFRVGFLEMFLFKALSF